VVKISEVIGNLNKDTAAVSVPRFKRWWRQTAIFLNKLLDDNHGFHIFHKLIKSVIFNCAALLFLLRVYFPKRAAAACIHYAQDYLLSGPRHRSTIFRTFFNIVVGVEGRLYIENSIFGNGTPVFLANW
jgi:hypothetical protein